MEPLKPPVNIAAYLLGGLRDETALEAALQLNDPILSRVVAHHPVLTPALRDRLLSSSEVDVLVLLARRSDLPAADKIKLLQRKLPQKNQTAVRVGVMILPLKAPPGAMTDELYEYASGQPWFTPHYQYSVATALAENSPYRTAALKRKEEIAKVGLEADNSYRTGFVAVGTNIKGLYHTIKAGYYNVDLPAGLVNLEMAELVKFIAKNELYSVALLAQLRELISGVGVEFYKMFFSLLPTWTGSLLALVTTAKSLSAA